MAQDGLLIDAIDLLETCVPTVPFKKKIKNRITASGLYASAFQSAYISALTHTVKTSEEYFKRYHHHIVTDVDLCPPEWKKFI